MYEKVINNVEFKCKNKITFEVIFYLKKEKNFSYILKMEQVFLYYFYRVSIDYCFKHLTNGINFFSFL